MSRVEALDVVRSSGISSGGGASSTYVLVSDSRLKQATAVVIDDSDSDFLTGAMFNGVSNLATGVDSTIVATSGSGFSVMSGWTWSSEPVWMNKLRKWQTLEKAPSMLFNTSTSPVAITIRQYLSGFDSGRMNWFFEILRIFKRGRIG